MKKFLTKYRGWVIFIIVVPVSFIYQKIQDFNSWVSRTILASGHLHEKKVSRIAGMVKQGFESGQKMCTARAPWKTMSIRKATYKDDLLQIPIDLRNILSIDKERMTVRVEPMVTMADITRFLNPRGLALAVQVEMDDLTVGGLCMGIGIETTSHKYGFLFETIKAYELVTARGDVLTVTESSHPELYHALPMSHGTHGFLVSVELEIVPIKKYMKLQYKPYYTRRELSQALAKYAGSEQQADYVEALAYNEGKGVLMLGELVDSAGDDGNVNAINRSTKPWFYTHVESMLEAGETVEYIPVRHYFHRHTPSMFFQLKDLIPFGNSKWYRWFFAWMGAPKVSLMKYTLTRELRRQSMHNRVAQDIIIPIGDMEDAFEFIDAEYKIYPMWVCPVLIKDHGELQGFIRRPLNTDADGSQMYVDLGIYGIPPAVQHGNFNAVDTARKLEQFVREKNGFSMLYADIFMTRIEFEEMFDHNLYRSVREQYHASRAFPEVYDKVIPEKWLIDIEEVNAM